MAAFSPPGARLHALIGDAVLDIPFHLVERLDAALADGGMPEPKPALIDFLDSMQRGDASDGEPWGEAGLPVDRCADLARVSRNLAALSAVMRLLHAVHRTRQQGDGRSSLDARVEQGLLLAGRELADSAVAVLDAGR